jgi:hypothetical protein
MGAIKIGFFLKYLEKNHATGDIRAMKTVKNHIKSKFKFVYVVWLFNIAKNINETYSIIV